MEINKHNVNEVISMFMSDMGTHDWAKQVLTVALSKDPVDAVNWLQVLTKILEARCDKVLGS